MIYRILAIITIFVVVLAPLIGIVITALQISWLAWGYIPIHLLIILKLFSWIKTIDTSETGSGGNEKLGTSEKVVAVVDNGRKKKSF